MTATTEDNAPAYAELHCMSNFSFLHGASHPEELVERAAELGYTALAITDEASMAGMARAHAAARQHDLHLIVGSEIALTDGPRLVLLATGHDGYSRLCGLITRGRRRAAKGEYRLNRDDLADGLPGCLALLLPDTETTTETADWLAARFGHRAWIAAELHRGPDDNARLHDLRALSHAAGLPLVAAGGVHMHVRGRRALQDTLTAIRHGVTLKEAGHRLLPNGERHLRARNALARHYPADLLAETLNVASRCRFSMAALRYEYPAELVPPDRTPAAHLRGLVEIGAEQRWPGGMAPAIATRIDDELALIAEMRYEHYFLTVHDLVAFARSRDILCQGRGSAANSVVCFCLGITEVDPVKRQMLFARFISKDRNEPPDIDVDFEHERREEVIQYIYAKYGRDRAALAATLITYRPRSAVRDVGRVLGLGADQVDSLAKNLAWWDGQEAFETRIREVGLGPASPVVTRLRRLVAELIGFPRHLSQHVGGFVISHRPLHELVPVENAAMRDRTVIQWDKDDLESLGLMKVDVLGLGMLSCLRRAFDLVADVRGVRHTLASLPAGDGPTYAMIRRADTVGVFQIESRAQMSMLPRLRPERFFDLVIEVAIVRPGPIQGGMVHPYLKRRQGKEPITYPSGELRSVLERTYGVPLFQEQAMQIAIVGAGYTPEDADRLRRAMATFKRTGQIESHRDKFLSGMARNGYDPEFSAHCFKQIEGFAEYGFPESHAASFALLVYVSAWLKCHHPDVFACALLNSQPMGFYAPAQIVRDARDHGVPVRPVDVNYSTWDNTLEAPDGSDRYALRLGFRQIKGLSAADALAIVANRPEVGYQDIYMMARQSNLSPGALEKLADADAFTSLGLPRREALWRVKRFGSGRKAPPGLPLFDTMNARAHNIGISAEFGPEAPVPLPEMSLGEEIVEDYSSLRLSLRAHPLSLIRDRLTRAGVRTARELTAIADGKPVTHAGLVIVRQRPGTAAGVVFLTMEDETGLANVVVWSKVFDAYRRVLMTAPVIGVEGKLQTEDSVTHIIADRILDLTGLLDSTIGDLRLERRRMGHPRNLSLKAVSAPAAGTKPLEPESLQSMADLSTPDRPNPLKVDSHDFH